MTTRGVKRMMTSILSRNNGQMTEANFKEVLNYAKKGQFTEGEKKALLQPGDYLSRSRYMRSADVTLDAIKFDPGAYKMAKELATTLGFDLFPGLPGAAPTDPGVPVTPTMDLHALVEARDAALAKGADLGSFEDWGLQTAGADLKFGIDIGGQKFPGLVLDKPQWKDPAARTLLTDNMDAFRNVDSLDGLKKFVEELMTREAAYFKVEGVDTKTTNERFGIQGVRRKAFFASVRSQISATKLDRSEASKMQSVLVPLEESLITGHDYTMDVGSHTNYWPYWNNYVDFLLKVLDQTAPDTDAFLAIKNRVSDICRRKTVFSWNRSIDEKNFESSVGGALIYNPQFTAGPGHRVSIKEGSTTYRPMYEMLSVKKDGLPDSLKEYAGAQVVRDGDKLIFDFMGKDVATDRTGQEVPAELKDHIESKDVDVEDLGIRKLERNERARSDISADWNSNGAINVAKIMIGWWGHCHNEAPGNAMGVDPQKGVDIYRADRGVKADKAKASFSSEDAWDVFGAFAADHEDGYGRVTSGNRLSPTRVDDTTFVGNRNNGGHWLNLTFEGSHRRVKIDAEVTGLWHKTDPTVKYDEPMSRYRRDVENDDGTFGPNPDWISTDMRDNDLITVDAKGRQMQVKTKFVTLNSSGMPYETTQSVHLDPSKDEFVKLADELSDRRPGGGGKVVEHWYNAKTNMYQEKIIEVAKKDDGSWERKEIEARDPIATDTVRSAQETTYDSVIKIHDFVTDDIGLPFTFDTSAGMAVWNYPVKHVRLDIDKTVSKSEEGKDFTYTTYRMQYNTMGGPSGDVRYTIKRDDAGKMVRAIALDPMPDFAYRNEHWVCAPVTLDVNGDVSYNLKGLNAGYLTDKARRTLVTALWERQAAILFSSLSDKTAENRAYVYETEDGNLISFANRDEYDAAVAADLKVREAEATTTPN